MEGWLMPQWTKVCASASPRVMEQGWISVQKLLSQKDKLANLANCTQARNRPATGVGASMGGGVEEGGGA